MEHRLTKLGHPWTNDQIERMNCTIKEATAKRFHYQSTQELNGYLQAFLLVYNHAKRLKTLRGLTPHEFVCSQWQKNPTIFTRDPTHLTLGLCTQSHFQVRVRGSHNGQTSFLRRLRSPIRWPFG